MGSSPARTASGRALQQDQTMKTVSPLQYNYELISQQSGHVDNLAVTAKKPRPSQATAASDMTGLDDSSELFMAFI
jgi:hypothetical protein